MPGPNLTIRKGSLSAEEAMGISRASLDRGLEGDAELSIVDLTTEATVLGAFQRKRDVDQTLPMFRRISGGPAVLVGPGTLHLVLALGRTNALVSCDARHLVNRYVRPLLNALTRCGALAHYFGRDWVSVGKRPVGQVGFAHDTESGRAVFEAFVAVSTPYALAGRASFLGKEPGTLASITGRTFDRELLQERVALAYAAAYERVPEARELGEIVGESSADELDDPPWDARLEEAIGIVAAGVDAAGRLRLGGELLASRDALGRVESRVVEIPRAERSESRVGRIVDEELSPSSVGLDGVRDLSSLRDVLLQALAPLPPQRTSSVTEPSPAPD